MIKPKYIIDIIVALFYGERNQNQAFSDCVIGNFFFEGASRSTVASVVEPFPTLVNKLQLMTNISRTSVLDVAVPLHPSLLLKVLF